jgi:hypothetical protein
MVLTDKRVLWRVTHGSLSGDVVFGPNVNVVEVGGVPDAFVGIGFRVGAPGGARAYCFVVEANDNNRTLFELTRSFNVHASENEMLRRARLGIDVQRLSK